MVFSSPIFIFCFLPATLLLYGLFFRFCKGNVQPANLVLLLASVFFYGWGGTRFLFLLLCIVAVNYALTLFMDRCRGGRKKLLLWLILLIDIGNLLYFKYFNFFAGNLETVFGFFGVPLDLDLPKVVLPIGISFYTFQIISYVADVYMGNVEVQKNPLKLALYVMMFPQLIAGPIVRYKDVNREIDERTIHVSDVEEGIRRFILGFSKKVFLANLTGGVADTMFGYGGKLNTAYSWLGILCYTLQIFFDFSAYSDMAIGIGRMTGFHFNENFDQPYVSESIQEFWRRWHISLSSWFKDYVYIPLGGNRKGKAKTYRNLGIVFLLTGLWHGAAWQFIIWGLYHGFFCILERVCLKKVLEKIPRFFRRVYTMLVVMIGWVFFRADNLSAACTYLGNLFSFDFTDFRYKLMISQMTPLFWVCLAAALLLSFTKRKQVSVETGSGRSRKRAGFLTLSRTAGNLLYLLLWLAAVLYLTGVSYNPFIYFQF